jgi:hypothetical protein
MGQNHQDSASNLQSAVKGRGWNGGFFHLPSLSIYFTTFFLGLLSSVLKNDPLISQSHSWVVGAQGHSGGLWKGSPSGGMDSWEMYTWLEATLPPLEAPALKSSPGGFQLQPNSAPSRGGGVAVESTVCCVTASLKETACSELEWKL